MKKRQYIVLAAMIVVVVIIAAFIAVGGLRPDNTAVDNPKQDQNSDNTGSDNGNVSDPAGNDSQGEDGLPDTDRNDADTGVIFSTKSDLDEDGSDEVIEIIKKQAESNSEELEGILRITGVGQTKEIPYVKKTAGNMTGLFSSIDIQDFDGDGIRDVFIKIPDAGSSFNLSSFFTYDFSGNRSFSYPGEAADFNPIALTEGFTFNYSGNGRLAVENAEYDFKAFLDLTRNPNLAASDDMNTVYNKSWIDPAAVDLGEDSGVKLVKENESVLVKLTYPVFGQATVDLIGELDIFIALNNEFKPVLKRFELFSFKDGNKQSVGKSADFKKN